MRHVFIPGADLSTPTARIVGPDAHHLATVLRVASGDRLVILDNAGCAAEAEISEVGKREVVVRLTGPAAVAPEPSLSITVAQALGKGDKFEQVVQHGTEAGASAFVPLLTERSVVRLDEKSAEEKPVRWRLIAKGAAEQSGRVRIPQVGSATNMKELVMRFQEFEETLLLHPEGSALWERLQSRNLQLGARNSSLLLLVGPEGGFSQSEVDQAVAGGARIVKIGDHVLRTETAALVAISQLLIADRLGYSLPMGVAE
jgi:16S rRNA (uracil1498-N3)-methyltransferase